MPTTVTTDPVASTTATPRMGAPLHLSPRTVAWLADHPAARQFVGSIWNTLTELERSGHYPGAIDALRRVLTQHQPTPGGRCRTCRRVTWRRRPFPCIVWHQIRFDLLGLFAGAGRHRQPAREDSGTAFPYEISGRSHNNTLSVPGIAVGPAAPSVNEITHQDDHR
jgi:hypothetical protein